MISGSTIIHYKENGVDLSVLLSTGITWDNFSIVVCIISDLPYIEREWRPFSSWEKNGTAMSFTWPSRSSSSVRYSHW